MREPNARSFLQIQELVDLESNCQFWEYLEEVSKTAFQHMPNTVLSAAVAGHIQDSTMQGVLAL